MGSRSSIQTRLLATAGAFGLYLILAGALYHVLGAGEAALSIVPVAIAGWLLGPRGGLLAGGLVFGLNTLLIDAYEGTGLLGVIHGGGGPGSVLIVLTGAAVGGLRDLLARVHAQAATLVQHERALREEVAARGRLEGAVRTTRAVAHELNNRLAVVVGYTELLTLELDGEAATFARMAYDSAREASATLERFQQIARYTETDLGGDPMLDLDASTDTPSHAAIPGGPRPGSVRLPARG